MAEDKIVNAYLNMFGHVDGRINIAPNEVGVVWKPTNTKDHNYHHHHFYDLNGRI